MREKQVDGDGVDGGESSMRRNEVERIREMQLTIAASSSVFPGFRFSPTDDELISYYLKKKLQGSDNCVDIIPEVDFCRHEPWDLPALSNIQSDNEWFFFSTRGKKYPNGSQSKRATQSGYWKATGKERNVKSGAVTIGTKRTLVFHIGRAPKGERTEWIMHEYCMRDTTQESLVVCRLRKNGDFRLTESSRGSSDHRNLSTVDNGDSGTNEYANTRRDGCDGDNTQMDGFDGDHTQMDGFDGDNTQMDGFVGDNTQVDGFHGDNAKMEGFDGIKSRSKGSKSRSKSHSVGQNDSESESDQQLTESPHGSSSPYKEGEDEDDCFADIINDDIIQLDESATQSLTFHGVFTGSNYMQKLPQETMSSHRQGTAVGRIKLRRQKGRAHHGKPPISPRGRDHPPEKTSSGCVLSALSGNADTVARWYHPRHLILLFLLLLVLLFVVWQGNYLNSKQHLGTGMEVIKRKLKYSLHQAADNI